MKKYLTVTMFLVLAVAVMSPFSVSAKTKAGTKPGSFFYFFDKAFEKADLFFTFNPEKKAKKALENADERLDEAEESANENDQKAVETAMQDYQENISLAETEAKLIKDETKTKELLSIIASSTSKHQEILEKVLNKVPAEAKEAIQKAIEASRKEGEESEKKIIEPEKEVSEIKQEIKETKNEPENKKDEQKKEIEELKKKNKDQEKPQANQNDQKLKKEVSELKIELPQNVVTTTLSYTDLHCPKVIKIEDSMGNVSSNNHLSGTFKKGDVKTITVIVTASDPQKLPLYYQYGSAGLIDGNSTIKDWSNDNNYTIDVTNAFPGAGRVLSFSVDNQDNFSCAGDYTDIHGSFIYTVIP